MREVTIPKDDLLSVLRANRTNHRESYEKARVGYQKKASEMLANVFETAKEDGFLTDLRVELFKIYQLPVPEDHTDDYDTVIHMAEMEVETDITLTRSEFEEYVEDNWGWKDRFATTNSLYGA